MDSALPCEFRRNLGFILDITIACAYNCTPASGLVLIRLEHSHTDGISGLPDSGIAASQGAPAAADSGRCAAAALAAEQRAPDHRPQAVAGFTRPGPHRDLQFQVRGLGWSAGDVGYDEWRGYFECGCKVLTSSVDCQAGVR